GAPDFTDWNANKEKLKNIVEQEEHWPLPNDQFLAFVKELSSREKLAMAQTLGFPFAKRPAKKWPDMLFMKLLHSTMLQSGKDLMIRRRLLLSILQHTAFLDDAMDVGLLELIAKQSDFIEQYGYWSYHWTFYFHKDK